MKKSLCICVLSLFSLALLPTVTWAAPCPATGCNTNVAASSFGALQAGSPFTTTSPTFNGVKYRITSSVRLSGGVYTYIFQVTVLTAPPNGLHELSVGSGAFNIVGLNFGFLTSLTTANTTGATFVQFPGSANNGSFKVIFPIGIKPGAHGTVTFYAQSTDPFTKVSFTGEDGLGANTVPNAAFAPLPEPTSATLLLTLVGCVTLVWSSRMGWRHLTSM